MIPVNEPLISDTEFRHVAECLKSGWISSTGKFVEEFERGWAEYCGLKYGVAVSSGTAALQVAIGCLDLEQGDEVIMPTFTIISCALAVIYNGGKPILVDADSRTWTMDVSQIEARIGRRTRAIMPVHIYGHPCNMEPIQKLAGTNDLVIIEDAAEAHGAEHNGKKCGSLGDIGCFSFYANKIVTTGEGGMLLTNNAEYAEKARALRNLCFRQDRRFYHTEMGHNFRLTNLQAAIGVAQLERIDELVEKKRWIAHNYNERLRDVRGLTLPVEEPWAKNVYWMYGVVLDQDVSMDAAEFARRLREQGVDTRPFFLGMHEQPVFHKMGLFKNQTYPVSERIARRGLYLPSGLTLAEDQIGRVSEAVKKALVI